MTVNRRNILGPPNPYDDGQKANYVDGGQAELSSRAGQFDGITSDVSDQQSHASAVRSSETQQAFRQAQHDAGLIGADQGAGGTRVAAIGSAVTGSIPASPQGDLIGQESPLVQRADGGDDPSASAYGKAIS